MTLPAGIRGPALVAAAVAIAYLGAFAGVFQFDDFKVIVGEPTVHSLAAWLADLGHGIRPLLKLTYALNWTLGPGETGFHAFNLAVHLVNTMLVYALAQWLSERHGLDAGREARVAAAVAALLFGLHPAHTEAVTYISGRSSSLMTAFYLGGLLAYAAGSARGRGWLLFGVSPALFAMAIATKEAAVSFPLALLWWEACRREGRPPWREIARRQAVHGLVLLVAVATLLAHPVYGTRVVPALDVQNLGQNLLSQVDAVSYLVFRLVRVHPLNIDPDLRMAAAWNLTLAVEATLLLALCVAGFLSLRRRPWWGLGLAWFVLALLPTNSLLPRPDLANDRHLYLASFGLLVAIGIEVARLTRESSPARRWAWPPVAAAIVLLGAMTATRNLDYASEIRLWEQTARVSPEKPRVFNNLGHAYGEAGRLELAERAYREALRLHPGYELARENLETVLRRKRDAEPLPR